MDLFISLPAAVVAFMLPILDIMGAYSTKQGLCQLLSTLAIFSTGTAAVHNTLRVNTTIGTVTGFTETTAPHVVQYLGIPFAEPPINNLRWLPPVAKVPIENGTINATSFGASCLQYAVDLPTVYTIDAPEFLVSGPTDEDCLTLNVWKPLGYGPEKLPVIVWIHGGAFQEGGGEIPYQIPTQWVERSQSHIVVGIK